MKFSTFEVVKTELAITSYGIKKKLEGEFPITLS